MKLFITGISTDVGKTVAAAILTEALEADYWKPVQAGELDNSDAIKVSRLISNPKSVIHGESYMLAIPASPHQAAKHDGVTIELSQIVEPATENHLVIEGAGGLLVPLNATDTIADLIRPDYKVVIVSRHYLGSINHTLLTIEALRSRDLTIAGIVFSGDENEASEEIILDKSRLNCLGRIEQEPYFDKNVIMEYAARFRDMILKLQ